MKEKMGVAGDVSTLADVTTNAPALLALLPSVLERRAMIVQ
jgi:hypothetical protein